MNLQRKIEIARAAIESIARHDDADLAVRQAALDKVSDIIGLELEDAHARVKAEIQAQTGAPPVAVELGA